MKTHLAVAHRIHKRPSDQCDIARCVHTERRWWSLIDWYLVYIWNSSCCLVAKNVFIIRFPLFPRAVLRGRHDHQTPELGSSICTFARREDCLCRIRISMHLSSVPDKTWQKAFISIICAEEHARTRTTPRKIIHHYRRSQEFDSSETSWFCFVW
jgi:hypothetical protein